MVNFVRLLVLGVLLVACQPKDNKETMVSGTPFYVGTYTQGESEGIYKFRLLDDGNLKADGLVAKTENPSYLSKRTDNRFLLAVNENDAGSVTAFEILEDSLRYINQSSSGGAHPCFVSINDQGFVLVANYTGGNIGLLQLVDNGELSPLLDVQQHAGKGSHVRQDKPHAHSVWFTPDGSTLISVDLGTNQLIFSTLDSKTKKFVPMPDKTLEMDPGSGPRHLTFHPEKPWIYIINELNSTVSLVRKEENGYFLKSSYTTLPENFSGENFTADIHISKDGKFLYASNRGHNSLAIFSIGVSGRLELLGHESTRGEWPRNFALSPDNSFLLVANQHSDNIVSFRRNIKTGKLEYITDVKAHSPVCILF